MRKSYIKPALSIDEQLALFKKRGLIIPDAEKARHYLSFVSYYRLSAYTKTLQDPSNHNHPFDPGTTFDHILDLYVFDRDLRLLILDAIERIEIGIRTQIIYQFSIKHGSWWFEDASLFNESEKHTEQLSRIDEEIRRSKEDFIKHYKTTYSHPSRPPAWMSLEVTPLGLLSILYGNLVNNNERKNVAKTFKLGHPKVLASWLHSLTYVRNTCAHHSRFWDRNLTLNAKWPSNPHSSWLSINEKQLPDKRKVYFYLAIIQYLLRVVTPSTKFGQNLNQLILSYSTVDTVEMGFPQNWEQDPFWRIKP